MRNIIRVGVLSQPELPKQLEPMIEAIFREQFRKLCSIFGPEKLTLVSSVECKVCELACICAVEEGLSLELEPLETRAALDEEEAEIRAKIHTILAKQPQTAERNERISEAALIEFSDIMVLVFDRSDPGRTSRFIGIRKLFLANDAIKTKLGKLIIDVNCPTRWSADADGEVYFEYVTRAPGQFGVSSEIEIPSRLIEKWNNAISAMPN